MSTPENPNDRRDDDVLARLWASLPWSEWASTLAQIGALRVTVPSVPAWSGMCLWCVREQAEGTMDDHTPKPPADRICTCPRHRERLLALAKHLRELLDDGENDGQMGGVA